MEDYTGYETVKENLITAGIKELENHGIADFSLRRVASLCNVSCAAPYKHFKSKENFIAEIIIYIHTQWALLQEQVTEIFKGDLKKQISEICIAYIKFWIANPNFRSVLMIKITDIHDDRIKNHLTDCTKTLIHKYCKIHSLPEAEETKKFYTVRSLVYGAALMLDNGELENTEQSINMIRECIEREFEQ